MLIVRSAEIQSKADQEVASAKELSRSKVHECEQLRQKLNEFHSYLTQIVQEKDAALQVQHTLLTVQDNLKLKYRFLEVSNRGKVRDYTSLSFNFYHRPLFS